MIVFDLKCGGGHAFEAWFASSTAFDEQRAVGRVVCPYCGGSEVEKALSAPRIAPKGDGPSADIVPRLAALQRKMLEGSTWVGDRFASEARAMAEGDAPEATIHGQATVEEARALSDDGIGVTPLPFPVVPPDQRN